MKSVPPDLMCPLKDVSFPLFDAYWSRIPKNDQVIHPEYSTHHSIYAIWHWERGVWWTCEALNLTVQATFRQLMQEGRLDLLRP